MNNTPTHTVRWGIVGAGRIANTFANDITLTQNATLYAIASRKLAPAQKFADAHDINTAYGSYAELFADPKVDAVYIATPHCYHKEHAIAALRAGKHVLCEKPVTLSLAELEEVISVAEQEQRYFMEGMWTYFLPVIHKAQQWINEGRIGTLRHVKAEFGYPLPYSPYLREYDNRLGGGCLMEMGIYPLAMAWLFLQQDPDQQSVWHHSAENGVEDDVVILNSYDKNSATAQLSTSFRCKLNNYLYLVCDEGYIAISDYWAAREAKLYKVDDCIDTFIEERTCAGFNHQIECVSRDILAGKIQPEQVSWDDSRALQRQMAKIKHAF
jgi:predicted dehydrogenase